jgi:hypothetical protein
MNGYEIFEQWMGDSNDAFAPLLSLGKITADTIESVARRNYNVAGDYFDLGLSQLKLLTAGNDVAKLGTEESRLANEFGNKFKAHADAYVRIAADAGEAYGAWTASLVETAKQAARRRLSPSRRRLRRALARGGPDDRAASILTFVAEQAWRL